MLKAILYGVLLCLEDLLAEATDRAYPIVGECFKRCACGDAILWVANLGVIDIVTSRTYIFFHSCRGIRC